MILFLMVLEFFRLASTSNDKSVNLNSELAERLCPRRHLEEKKCWLAERLCPSPLFGSEAMKAVCLCDVSAIRADLSLTRGIHF